MPVVKTVSSVTPTPITNPCSFGFKSSNFGIMIFEFY